MTYSRKLLEWILQPFNKVNDNEFIRAVSSTGNELPNRDIKKHPKLNNLVVGKILSYESIPDTHLNYCKVQIDNKKNIKNIICGAPNVTANKLVIVALPGAVLHDGRKIEEKVVKGHKSEGMLCAYNELTPLNNNLLSKHDAQGILLLKDGEAKVGDKNVAKLLGLDDTVYEIEVPFSNRNDIDGALAFAQDIASFFKWDYAYPKPNFGKKVLKNKITIDKKVCNGFCIGKVVDIHIEESPWTIKSLLMNNGYKPLNNILDLLNIITILTNTPTSAYDADKCKDFEAGFAKNGEKFLGFDGKEYKLTNKDAVVRSNGEIICLGGILGDAKYGINNETKNIYVEFANWNFVNIRNTAAKNGIQTDAAKRISKKVPTYVTMVGASLLQDLFYDNFVGYKIECKPEEIKPIKIDVEYANGILGEKLKLAEITKYLKLLGFTIKGEYAYPPPFRLDVSTSQDLVEELIKPMDVQKIVPEPLKIDGMVENKYTEYYFINKLWKIMSDNYFSEVKNYNTISEENLVKFNVFNYKENVKVVSANNINRQYLRNNSIYSMLMNYKKNVSYKNDLLPIYEIQKIYQNKKPGIKNISFITPEVYYLDRTTGAKIVYNINGLIGLVNEVASLFNATLTYKRATSPYFYDNECVSVNYKNKVVGYIGAIKNSLLKECGIQNEKIYACALNWEEMYDAYSVKKNLNITPVSSMMNLYKDLTFGYQSEQDYTEVLKQVEKLSYVQEIIPFDKYVKGDLITYTFRVLFVNNQNISSDEINKYIKEVITLFEKSGFKLNP